MDDVLKVALTRLPEPLEDIAAETGFRPYIEKSPDVRQDSVMH
jgi:hypothetical protein